MSDLSRYMLAHYDELYDLLAVRGYSWEAVTRIILVGQAGLADTTGKPVTGDIAKLAWSRIRRRRGGAGSRTAALPAAAAPFQQQAAVEPQTPETHSQNRDALFAANTEPRTAIQLARPRSAVSPATPSKNAALSMPSLLSEDEVERRITDLGKRQGGPKIPSPDVL